MMWGYGILLIFNGYVGWVLMKTPQSALEAACHSVGLWIDDPGAVHIAIALEVAMPHIERAVLESVFAPRHGYDAPSCWEIVRDRLRELGRELT
jgi:hypothetical protein